MALTIAILPPAQPLVANQTMNYVASVTNSGAASVTLTGLQVSEITESDAQVSQPLFMVPNSAPGAGNPTLSPSTTYYYPFQVVYNSPAQSGPSPQAPGGAASASAAVTPDATFAIQLISTSSDGTIATTSLASGVAAAIAPFPIPLGGALRGNAGANLINLLTM